MSKETLYSVLRRVDSASSLGGLKELVSYGIISYSVAYHYEIYLQYDTFKTKGFSKKACIDNVANNFDIDISTVYRVIKSMNS